jgi:hypothetical protein
MGLLTAINTLPSNFLLSQTNRTGSWAVDLFGKELRDLLGEELGK